MDTTGSVSLSKGSIFKVQSRYLAPLNITGFLYFDISRLSTQLSLALGMHNGPLTSSQVNNETIHVDRTSCKNFASTFSENPKMTSLKLLSTVYFLNHSSYIPLTSRYEWLKFWQIDFSIPFLYKFQSQPNFSKQNKKLGSQHTINPDCNVLSWSKHFKSPKYQVQ